MTFYTISLDRQLWSLNFLIPQLNNESIHFYLIIASNESSHDFSQTNPKYFGLDNLRYGTSCIWIVM